MFKFSKAYICCGGGESVEAALKFCEHFNKKKKFISLKYSFHGSTGETSYLSFDPDVKKKEKKKFIYVDPPYCYRCPYNKNSQSCNFECVKKINEIIKINKNEVSALVLEPVIGINGFIFPPKEFLKQISEICKRNNLLMIFDEVLTGFFRTGTFFAYQNYGVVPDILCASKGMNSGYAPIGTTLVSKEISKYLEKNPLELGNTNMAHPVSCAAAIKTIEILKNPKIFSSIKNKEKIIKKECNKLKKLYPNLIGDIRGKGLLFCLELIKDKDKSKLNEKEMIYFLSLLMGEGIFINADPTKSILPLAPPFIISNKEILKTFKIISECMEKFRIYLKLPFSFSS